MWSRIARIWNALPTWLRSLVAAILIVALIEMPYSLPTHGAGLILTAVGTALFTGVSFAFVLRQSLGEADPAQVVADAEAANDRQHPYIAIALVAVLVAVVAVTIWAVAYTAARLNDKPMGETSLVLAVCFGAGIAGPFLVTPAMWIAGLLAGPVELRVRFRLMLRGDCADPLSARAAIDSIPNYSMSLTQARRVAEDGAPRYRLDAVGLRARMTGIGQFITVEHLAPGRRLELHTLTDGGDEEWLVYTVAALGAEGCSVSCDLKNRIVSPFMRAFIRFVGLRHVGKGAAEIDAARMRKIAGGEVKVEDWRFIDV